MREIIMGILMSMQSALSMPRAPEPSEFIGEWTITDGNEVCKVRLEDTNLEYGMLSVVEVKCSGESLSKNAKTAIFRWDSMKFYDSKGKIIVGFVLNGSKYVPRLGNLKMGLSRTEK